LPLKGDNEQNWSVTKSLLANTALMPVAADIQRAREHTAELLKIRKGSKLFRLENAQQIQELVSFYNNGTDQIPGVIVMAIKDSSANLDPNAEMILVIFNANTSSKILTLADLKGWDFSLHAVQQQSTDARVKQASADNSKGEFTVPARTAAVFVATKKPVTPTTPTPPTTPKNPKGGAMGGWLLLLLASCLLVSRRRSLSMV
jgi:pullulanase